MKILLILLLLCSSVYADSFLGSEVAQPVDLIALSGGFYTSAATITGSVSTIPLYGNFTNRRSIAITNSSDYNSVYIYDTPFKDPVDAGYELLPNTTLIMDIDYKITNSTIYSSTSDSTIAVSISTIEVR